MRLRQSIMLRERGLQAASAGLVRAGQEFNASRANGSRSELKPAPRNRASVLIIVLWVSIGLVSIALYFANTMTYELRAADNRVSGLAAEQAIEGAAHYVAAVLTTYATNGAVPLATDFACAGASIGDARYWIIGRDPAESQPTEPFFGLVDEGAKLNINRVGSNTLSYLPNMDLNFAEAIVDWRNTNASTTLNYADYGYEPKRAPFETLDELRLVDGATVDLLVGDDVNRNGALDANEENVNSLSASGSGLFEYVTPYSREPNFHVDGTSLTNVNTQADLRNLLQNALGSSRTQQIMGTLGYGQGPGNAPVPFVSLLEFYLQSGMTSAEFDKIYNDATVSTNSPFTTGRVNLNTASTAVMTALFMGMGLDQNTATGAADTLLTYRQQNPYSLNSIAWIVDALGRTHQVVRSLAGRDLVTTHSFQFTADIAAVGAYGRGYRRVKFIFDLSEGTPKIIYRQDLSRLGWALGEKARQTYVAMDTK
jgi:type II secretory pathway component PulK